ncbi:hypothetical protein HDV06_000608 [Boothiomyces sp. JEL0866]|nr:hypothetical protein HDV06_000608 [Boothiomyces sp. JEL0866]
MSNLNLKEKQKLLQFYERQAESLKKELARSSSAAHELQQIPPIIPQLPDQAFVNTQYPNKIDAAQNSPPLKSNSQTKNMNIINSNLKRLHFLWNSIQPGADIKLIISELMIWCNNPDAYYKTYLPYLSAILVQIAKQSIELPNNPKLFFALLDVIKQHHRFYSEAFDELIGILQAYRFLVGLNSFNPYDKLVFEYRSKLTEWVQPIMVRIKQEFNVTVLDSNSFSNQTTNSVSTLSNPIRQPSYPPPTQTSLPIASNLIQMSPNVREATYLQPPTISLPLPTAISNSPAVPSQRSECFIPLTLKVIFQFGSVKPQKNSYFGFDVIKEHLKHGDKNTNIHIRCYRMTDSSERHDWPVNLHRIIVNEKEIQLRKKKYERTPDNLLRTIGSNWPSLIQTVLKEGRATLAIYFYPGVVSTEDYVFKIESFLALLPKYAIDFVKNQPAIGMDELFNGSDDDCMIIIDSMPLSLTCPLTMKRMNAPVRSSYCKHLNCFDLDSWIGSYASGPPVVVNLTCPICSKHIDLCTLKMDLIVKKILELTPVDITLSYETKQCDTNKTVEVQGDPNALKISNTTLVDISKQSVPTENHSEKSSGQSAVSTAATQHPTLILEPKQGSQPQPNESRNTNTAGNILSEESAFSQKKIQRRLLNQTVMPPLTYQTTIPIPDSYILSSTPRNPQNFENANIISKMWELHDKPDNEKLSDDPPTTIVSRDYEDATDIKKIIHSIFDSDNDDDATVAAEMHKWEYVNYLSDNEI